MPTRQIVLCSHHGTAVEGDDRQRNGACRGNATTQLEIALIQHDERKTDAQTHRRTDAAAT